MTMHDHIQELRAELAGAMTRAERKQIAAELAAAEAAYRGAADRGEAAA